MARFGFPEVTLLPDPDDPDKYLPEQIQSYHTKRSISQMLMRHRDNWQFGPETQPDLATMPGLIPIKIPDFHRNRVADLYIIAATCPKITSFGLLDLEISSGFCLTHRAQVNIIPQGDAFSPQIYEQMLAILCFEANQLNSNILIIPQRISLPATVPIDPNNPAISFAPNPDLSQQLFQLISPYL